MFGSLAPRGLPVYAERSERTCAAVGRSGFVLRKFVDCEERKLEKELAKLQGKLSGIRAAGKALVVSRCRRG